MNPTLYEQDYYLWLEQTAKLLARGQWDEVDIANLVEEIKDMGKSERRALESNLTIVLLYLLKYKYQATHRSNSWLSSILEHCLRIKKQLKESPSLKPYLEQVFAECYGDGILRAAVETRLQINTFPTNSPFTIEEVLDINYLPDALTPDMA
ncbi:DUF29 domain-containing protein [Microseira wollei]|uniref:DUF29 domain-containing protein n=1 Tax=Microseira wollei NIES-4236 TaxID=2530354 RepID=A0AAV3XRG2_9CYAN|nr:DUF29 domain-containing protein [Microseira wollei]GET43815.1 hypothetical protein MiSe_86410 [Microseira wollei NIES-4236]